MSTLVKDTQIIKSINNLHLRGIIKKTKDVDPLFATDTTGAIPVKTVGLYQVLDELITNLSEIKDKDNIIRKNDVPFYDNYILRYSLKNREIQLNNLLNIIPKTTNTNNVDIIDLVNTNSLLQCNIRYNNIKTSSNTSIIVLNTPTNSEQFESSGTEIDGFQIDTTSSITTATNLKEAINKRYTSIIKYNDDLFLSTDNRNITLNTPSNESILFTIKTASASGTEFNRGLNSDITAENLTTVINSNSNFLAELNKTHKIIIVRCKSQNSINNNSFNFNNGITYVGNFVKRFTATMDNQNYPNVIKVTQSNTDGSILPNKSFFDYTQIPLITDFSPLKYTEYIANIKSSNPNIQLRGNDDIGDLRLSMLTVGKDNQGNPIKKYSEDALFEFFGRMLYDFIKLNNNHTGNEGIVPGKFKIGTISSHHLNSVENYDINSTQIKRKNFINTIRYLRKTGNFGGENNLTQYKQYRSQFSAKSNNLFSNNTYPSNIPYIDKPSNKGSIGLYQLINQILLEVSILKKKIRSKEKLFKESLENIDINNHVELSNDNVNNITALNIVCRTQGNIETIFKKPSYIRINDTNKNIEAKYSQDALFELSSRWCNEIIKLNYGHSGYEDIYPGQYNIEDEVNSAHHMNSVTNQK